MIKKSDHVQSEIQETNIDSDFFFKDDNCQKESLVELDKNHQCNANPSASFEALQPSISSVKLETGDDYKSDDYKVMYICIYIYIIMTVKTR